MLRGLMRDIPVLDDAGNHPRSPAEVVAKTGTLNFVSTLAGYVQIPSGRSLAFSPCSAPIWTAGTV
jgi:D-alanyl-D-alanine carboxypeptidase/D-alanyl-D-alanine-endopeptidase (penicillin-binding protein 4)